MSLTDINSALRKSVSGLSEIGWRIYKNVQRDESIFLLCQNLSGLSNGAKLMQVVKYNTVSGAFHVGTASVMHRR